MKKLLLIILFILIIIKLHQVQEKKTIEIEEMRGVFISYIEISDYLQDQDEEKSKQIIISMIEKCQKEKLNTIILQVRPSSDAIYPSNVFPVSKYLSSKEELSFDVLQYFIEETHKRKMKLIAWINPYRIKTNDKVEELSQNSPAIPYLNTDIVYIKNGIYWNPSKIETTSLIVEGVKEVLNYKVDGIIFDDYFYPDNQVDYDDYLKYVEINPEISLEEYHLEVVNQMIKKVYKECKEKKIMFGISPEGNMDNNYHKNYADVKKWLESDEYIDFIMPQLYYGFYNSVKPFLPTLEEWESYIKNKQIKLVVALSIYKAGQFDQYAIAGKDEWMNEHNLIQRQVLLSRNRNQYYGFTLFRYGSIFDEKLNQYSKIEMYNLQKIIK